MNVFAACGDDDKLEDSAMKAMTAAFVRPGEDGKMKMVSLYDKGDSSKMKKEETEQVDENVAGLAKKALDKGAEFMDTNPVGKAIKNVLKPVRPEVPPAIQQNRERNKEFIQKRNAARKATAGGGVPSQDGQVDRYRDAARRRAQQRDMENSRGK